MTLCMRVPAAAEFSMSEPPPCFPRKGGMVWLEYAFQDQNINWSGSSRAPAVDNNDKEIRTSFVTAGLQYMFSRQWGVQVEVPTPIAISRRRAAQPAAILSPTPGGAGDVRVEAFTPAFSPTVGGHRFRIQAAHRRLHPQRRLRRYRSRQRNRNRKPGCAAGGILPAHLTADNRWTAFTQALLDIHSWGETNTSPARSLDARSGVYYPACTWQRRDRSNRTIAVQLPPGRFPATRHPARWRPAIRACSAVRVWS